MLDPQILDLKGVKVDLRIWRGRDNLLRARLAKSDGITPEPLLDQDVTLTIYDASGALQHTWTNASPSGHFDEAMGLTDLSVPASVTAGLEGRRSHTWKYEIVRRDQNTNFTAPYFYGDVQIDPGPGAT